MKAEVKRFHSPDVFDLSKFKPVDEKNFGFLLQVMIGIEGEEGEESFDIYVCTPQRLERQYGKSDVVFGEHLLIVQEYDFPRIQRRILEYVDKIEGETWDEIGALIDRIGKWEFRDYRP